MAKKKQKQQSKQNVQLSPEKYIRTKVRSLPIMESLMNEDWQEGGLGWVIVARQHKSGNYTLGLYLLDTFCLGVKDTHYKFNISPDEYEDLKERISEYNDIVSVSYNEVHNLIYGAIAYAGNYGFSSHPDFSLTQYILEEEDENIPLIEYEYGKDGKPFLMVNTQLEASKYLPILQKTAGEGNYHFSIGGEDIFDDDEYDDYEEVDDSEDGLFQYDDLEQLANSMAAFSAKMKEVEEMPHTDYTYTRSDYPETLNYKHKELDVFYDEDNLSSLSRENVDNILALPREELIADLQHIIFYEIGQTCGEISEELWDAPYSGVLMHALFFLGELRDESSLDVVLEVMRQNRDFQEYHFGDSSDEILPLTLYKIGSNSLSQLFNYIKEPGLYVFLRIDVFSVLTYIVKYEPERRIEVISWYRAVLQFYLENINNSTVYDATLAGMMMVELLNIKAVELLPEIKKLYDTKQIDVMCCGQYSVVEEDMLSSVSHDFRNYGLMDIYERYKKYEEKWGR